MKITQDLLFLTREKIENHLLQHIDQAFHEVKQVYLAFAEGKATNPPSSFLWYDEERRARIIALPACVEEESKKILGIKWISSCPDNITNNLPRASALIILNDDATGFPIAVLEGAVISALRTVLSALIAVENLHQDKSIETLGIIGCGTIATNFIRCMRALGWKENNILLFDLSADRMKQFSETICPTAQHCKTVEEVTSKSSVLLLTTTTITPYLLHTDLFMKRSIILNLSLRDIGAQVILDAFNIVDDIEHVLHANTSPHLAYLLTGQTQFIHGTLASLMKKNIQIDEDNIKVFSPMGMGILDLALANLVYKHYENLSEKNCVKDFF